MKTDKELAQNMIARGVDLAALAQRALRIAHKRGYVTHGLAGCETLIAAKVLGLIQPSRRKGHYKLTQKGWQVSFPGLVECRVARSTKTRVMLYDSNVAGLDTDAGPWATVCDPHGGVVHHPTRKIAREWMATPEEWCPGCADRK